MKFRLLLALLFASATSLFAQAPANDNFANAQVVTGASGNVTGSNVNATLEAGEATTVDGYTSGRSVWFRWTAPETGSTTFSTDGAVTSFDAQLSVYSGSALNALTLLGDSDLGSEEEQVGFSAVAGTVYRIRVAGYQSASGPLKLVWAQAGPPRGEFSIESVEVAENEVGQTATLTVTRNNGSAGSVTVDYETVNESAEAGSDYTAKNGTLTFGDGIVSQTLSITITNDTALEGYEEFGVMLSNPTNGAQIEEDYAFVGILDDEHPTNDNFANAQAISGATGTAAGTNLNATAEGAEGVNSVWYRWTAPASATPQGYRFSVASGFLSGEFKVYTGTTLGNLVEVSSKTAGGFLVFEAVGGAQYYVQVFDSFGYEGAFDLSWSESAGILRVANATVDETAGAIQVSVLRESGASGAVTVTLSTSDNSASASDDYTSTGTIPVNFANGETSKTVNISIVDDTQLEGTETFYVELSSPTAGALLSDDSTGEVTILDNEHPANDAFASPILIANATGSIAGTNLNATTEGGETFGQTSVWFSWTAPASGWFEFSLDNSNITGLVDIFSGNALNNLTLKAATPDATVQAAANDVFYIRVRADYPGDEGSFDLVWRELPGQIRSVVAPVSEGAGTVLVTLLRERGDAGAAVINYDTFSSSATATSDFTQSSGSVSFADGETSKTFTVPIIQDQQIEGTEYFYVELSTASQVLIPDPYVEVIIKDDDVPANDNFADAIVITGPSGTVNGNGRNASIEAGEPNGSGSVWYRWVAPSSGLFEFYDAAGINIFTGNSFGNLSFETPRGVHVYLQATANTEYRIRVDGNSSAFDLKWRLAPGSFRFVSSNFVGEGAGSVTVTVLRENGSAGGVSVSYETFDSNAEATTDYTAVNGTLNFADGETSKTIQVPILQDSVVEGVEYFSIGGSDLTFGSSLSQHYIGINDDDRPANDNFASAQNLAGNSGSVSLSFSNASRETGEPTDAGGTKATLWYNWTAPADGAVFFRNDEFAGMAAFTGAAVNALTLVESDPHGNGLLFAVTSGTTYRIAFFSSDAVNTQLHWEFSPGGAFEIVSGYDYLDTSDSAYASIREDVGQYVVTVRRVGGTAPATVDFSLSADSAAAPGDYTDVSGTLAFGAGELLKTITIPFINDNNLEGTEAFSLSLDGSTPTALIPRVRSIYIEIDDDDDDPENDRFANAIALNASVSDGVVDGRNQGASTETGEPNPFSDAFVDGRSIWYKYTAQQNGVLTLAGFSYQDFDYDHRHGLYLAAYTGADLNDLTEVETGYDEEFSSPVTFNVEQGVTYYIRVETDSDIEFDHTQGVELSYFFSEGGGPIANTFGFDFNPQFVEGSALSLPVTIERFGDATAAVTIKLNYSYSDASPGLDFVPVVGEITFLAGETSKVIQIPILNDSLVEGDEYFSLQLNTLNGDYLAEHYVGIEDDDDNPVNDFFANAAVIAGPLGSVEGTTVGAGMEDHEPWQHGSRTVWYRWVSPGSGVARFFVSGQFETYVYTGTNLASLKPIANSYDGVTFGTVAGQTYFLAVTAYSEEDFQLTYVFDSTQSVLSFQSSYVEAGEETGSISLVVNREGNLSGTASVAVKVQSYSAVAGSDFTLPPATLSFAPGESRKAILIPVTNDSEIEDYEDFEVLLHMPTGALVGNQHQAYVAILDDDDDPVNDEFEDAILLTGEVGSIDGSNVGAESDEQLGDHGAYFYGSNGVWYKWVAPASGTMNLFVVDSTTYADLSVYQGTTRENLQYTDLYHSGAGTFAALQGETYYILVSGDGDTGDFTIGWHLEPGVEVNFQGTSVSVGESAGQVEVTVTLSAAAASTVVVDYDADGIDESSDFTPPIGTLVFAPGETSKKIVIPILPDTLFEGDESFPVEINFVTGPAVVGLNSYFEVTIEDDETLLPSSTSFTGLVEGDEFSHGSAGLLTLKLTARGTFTGKVFWGGKKYSFKGLLNPDGTATATASRGRLLSPLTLKLLIVDGGTRITGTVSDGTNTSDIEGDKLAFSKLVLSEDMGDYSLLLPAVTPDANEEPVDAPAGHGWAKMKVSKLGLATIKGSLADGTKISLGVQASESGEVPVYLALYGGKGSLTGEIEIEDEDIPDADGGGRLNWFKPGALPKQKVYPNGFDLEIDSILSKFTYVAGQRVFLNPDGLGVFVADEGGLLEGVGQTFSLSTLNKLVLDANPDAVVKLSLTAKTGLYRGTFKPTGETKAVPFSGVLFQKRNVGGGFFLKPDALGIKHSGFVELQPANP